MGTSSILTKNVGRKTPSFSLSLSLSLSRGHRKRARGCEWWPVRRIDSWSTLFTVPGTLSRKRPQESGEIRGILATVSVWSVLAEFLGFLGILARFSSILGGILTGFCVILMRIRPDSPPECGYSPPLGLDPLPDVPRIDS